MHSLDYQKMLEMIAVVLRCPVCGARYGVEQTQILDSKETDRYGYRQVLVHSDCEMCHGSMVFSVAADGFEVFSVGMLTDLSAGDSEKFRGQLAISTAEVLEFQNFLKSFGGDFARAVGI